jgi:hypothetical protein
MATASSLANGCSTLNTVNTTKTISIPNLSRSVERALDEASYTGELVLSGRKLREFPNYPYTNNKCDLSDTTTAGWFFS